MLEDLEEYKRKLKERVAREVVPILFPPPSPRELFTSNPTPPLPPQLLERLERPYNGSEAKRYVLEALNYIRENKEAVENELKKRLKPPIYLVPSEEPPEDLEENYIVVLKEWAREKAKELRELSEASKRAAESMEKEFRERHPEWEDLRREFFDKIGPLALILPPQVLKALKEHNLLDDEEVNEALRRVNEAMLKPIHVAIAEHIVESIPEWYLRALYESKKTG